jgi:D-glycero-alpha-D-manno-heptose-7-phosphate kinase
MTTDLKKILEQGTIEASAPCRVDMGGTLDIGTFFLQLGFHEPCTFNIAINLRTKIRLLPYRKGRIKVSSDGFESLEFPAGQAPFDSRLGLIFAIVSHFNVSGIHVDIVSASPPRSGLGGSSSAAVALVFGLSHALSLVTSRQPLSRKATAMLARTIEESVAGVPCGYQDHLSAVYGGINAWFWPGRIDGPVFVRKMVIKKSLSGAVNDCILVAYCGLPHDSKDINTIWFQQFIAGQSRREWLEIVRLTRAFVAAVCKHDFRRAAVLMNREVAIRRKLTPQVLTETGEQLVESAVENGCGARFTGAGGGGCIWAIGDATEIAVTRSAWKSISEKAHPASLLDIAIDNKGVTLP